MATAQYDRENTRRINLKLNKNTDREIIEHLERQQNIQGYLKDLIRKDMKGESTMASRAYYTGSMVSSTVLENMIADMQEDSDQDEFDRLSDNYRQYMITALETLDDRFWWEPETSTVYYEDDGSGKPLPETEDFENWWSETTSAWIDQLIPQ